MEFHENRAKQPFIGFRTGWRANKAWRLQGQTRQLLQQMSDERLKDIGLRRDQVRAFSFIDIGWGERPAAGIHSQYLSINASASPFLDTYPDKYYFLLS
jgi:uncharacterized protein YjiS (DUF1127 family)